MCTILIAMVDGYSNGMVNGWSYTPVTENCSLMMLRRGVA